MEINHQWCIFRTAISFITYSRVLERSNLCYFVDPDKSRAGTLSSLLVPCHTPASNLPELSSWKPLSNRDFLGTVSTDIKPSVQRSHLLSHSPAFWVWPALTERNALFISKKYRLLWEGVWEGRLLTAIVWKILVIAARDPSSRVT